MKSTPHHTVPKHIAIIMDGNGRWALKRFLPRVVGHQRGVESVRKVVKACQQKGVQALTLFAFSSENWGRPKDEVQALMGLILKLLKKELNELHNNNVCLRIIGDVSTLSPSLQKAIDAAEKKTKHNTGLDLNIALNYGGKWDIVQAAKTIVQQALEGKITIDDIDESYFDSHLSLADLPKPDLLIRTSSEQRISNFLLWQLAYSEFYFTDIHWPDFDEQALVEAIAHYQGKERRFGKTSAQVVAS